MVESVIIPLARLKELEAAAAETLALLLICHPLICSRLEMVSVRAVAAAHRVLRHVPALLYDVGLEMIWRKQ